MLSKQKQILKIVKERGYVVDVEGNVFNPEGKQLALYTSVGKWKGYKSFTVKFEGHYTKCSVHKLQAYQKFGDAVFEDNIVTRHLNGISTDNSFHNISIGTQSQNMLDVPKEKRIITVSNPKHDHEAILADIASGMKYKQVMEKYGISSKGTLSFIVNKSLKKQGVL